MNEIVSNVLLTGDMFMSKLHLRQPEFIDIVSGLFTLHRKMIKKLKETDYLNYIYQNKLDNACFIYEVVYAGSKYLVKRTASDKFMKDRAYEIALNPQYDEYWWRSLSSKNYKN